MVIDLCGSMSFESFEGRGSDLVEEGRGEFGGIVRRGSGIDEGGSEIGEEDGEDGVEGIVYWIVDDFS